MGRRNVRRYRVEVDAENDLEHESVQSMGLDEGEQREHGGRAATPSGSAQFALLDRRPIVVSTVRTMLHVEDETMAGRVRGREGLECVTVDRHH
jgi:hypothetical protein